VAGLKKKSALKKLMPAHSALLRQKKLAGQTLSGGKSTITKDLRGTKKLAQQSKAASSMKQATSSIKKAPPSAKKLGSMTKSKANLTRPPKLGGLFGGRRPRIR
jgi:hypothetical protein